MEQRNKEAFKENGSRTKEERFTHDSFDEIFNRKMIDRNDDHAFLTGKSFHVCHLKKPDPKGGWPLAFAHVYATDILLLYMTDEYGSVTEQVRYLSVDHILDNGWVVD